MFNEVSQSFLAFLLVARSSFEHNGEMCNKDFSTLKNDTQAIGKREYVRINFKHALGIQSEDFPIGSFFLKYNSIV